MTKRIACRREQQLQIGAGKPFAGTRENLRRSHAEGQRAITNREEARHLFHQAQPTRQLIGAEHILYAMLYARDVMILQIGADARQILQHLNPQRA